MISDKTYDLVKWLAQYVLPALATLYFALAQIWNFPYPDQIVGTIVAFDAFLGLVIGLSTIKYKSTPQEPKSMDVPTLPIKPAKRRTGVIIKMSNEVYDVLIMFVRYILPALGTFVFTLSGVWGFESGDKIIGTIAAVNTFLGVALGISSAQYKTEMSSFSELTPRSPYSR